jgi:hypothetical protein
LVLSLEQLILYSFLALLIRFSVPGQWQEVVRDKVNCILLNLLAFVSLGVHLVKTRSTRTQRTPFVCIGSVTLLMHSLLVRIIRVGVFPKLTHQCVILMLLVLVIPVLLVNFL